MPGWIPVVSTQLCEPCQPCRSASAHAGCAGPHDAAMAASTGQSASAALADMPCKQSCRAVACTRTPRHSRPTAYSAANVSSAVTCAGPRGQRAVVAAAATGSHTGCTTHAAAIAVRPTIQLAELTQRRGACTVTSSVPAMSAACTAKSVKLPAMLPNRAYALWRTVHPSI